MREMSIREIQKCELAILRHVAEICEENDLKYFLAGGTLLGAIRHGGFIPWDDDIDIIMPRPDYEKFEKIYEGFNLNPQIKLLTIKTSDKLFRPFARASAENTVLLTKTKETREFSGDAIGVFVDIFPMDGIPEDIRKSNIFFMAQMFLRNLCHAYLNKNFKWKMGTPALLNMLAFLYRLPPMVLNKIRVRMLLLNIITKNAKRYKFENSKFVAVSCGGQGFRERIEKKFMLEQIEVEFEGEIFKTTKHYEEYLGNLYGNYMKLPPEDERKSTHPFKAYRRKGNMNIAILTAAGTGGRMGQDIPKQFLHIENKPIIIYTLEAFQEHPSVDAIAVACLDGWHDILRAYAHQFGITKLKWVVSGGETGQESIYNGLRALKDVCVDDDIVIIHDGNRAMVSQEVISDCLAETIMRGCAIAAIPCVEAILLSKDHVSSSEHIDRSALKRTQTPHGFKYAKIMSIYKKAEELGIKNSAAPCVLAIETGETVHFSNGSEKNIKLTTVDDIEIFKALLTVEKDSYLKVAAE